MFKYFSPANMSAGFVGILVGFTSSAVLVFQAATAAGANEAEISSWLLALGLSTAITCIGLSLRYRIPILTGWSTPGAALLVTSLSGVTMPEAIGAFIISALLTTLSGVTGLFERVMTQIPRSLSAAMLAGILFHFGVNVFSSMQHQFFLVSMMFVTYLIGKRLFPRYVIVLVLLLGILIAKQQGLFHFNPIHLTLSKPIFTAPIFSLSAFISVSLPLFIVTMTSQNIPGVAVIKANGYEAPISKLITWIGTTTLFLAPFGCYSINLAAITAAICMGKEADKDPSKRYRATVFAGLCWLALGIFGATVVAIFSAFPEELVLSIAGIALFTTIGNSLKVALEEESQREPALITILVSASGISLYGVGAAFWGLMAGILSLFFLNWRNKENELSPSPVVK